MKTRNHSSAPLIWYISGEQSQKNLKSNKSTKATSGKMEILCFVFTGPMSVNMDLTYVYCSVVFTRYFNTRCRPTY